jgi:hypothetical protein
MSPSSIQVNEKTANNPNLDVEKAEVEQFEDVLNQVTSPDEEPPRSVSILDWFQKKNPSPQFLADVAKVNETQLDARKVKHVERKIDLLIMPALAVCYMFYYVDKTTLSYAAIFNIKKDLHLGSSEYVCVSGGSLT